MDGKHARLYNCYFQHGYELFSLLNLNNTFYNLKDLGVTVTESFKSSKQCNTAAAKANGILGIIKKNLFMKGRYRVIEVV